MKDEERDLLRKTILEFCRQECHYTDLDKKVCGTCHPFATTNTFKSQLAYLLRSGFIERIGRGVYKITEKGRNYLVILT